MTATKETSEVRTGSRDANQARTTAPTWCAQCGDPSNGRGYCSLCREAARLGCLWARPRRPPPKTCVVCGVAFRPRTGRQEACGLVCGRALAKQRSDVARAANAKARRARVCEQCGTSFIAANPSGKARRGEVREGRFCSRKCAAKSVRIYPSRAAARRAEYDRRKARGRVAPEGDR
jgi:hypothetical protein